MREFLAAYLGQDKGLGADSGFGLADAVAAERWLARLTERQRAKERP